MNRSSRAVRMTLLATSVVLLLCGAVSYIAVRASAGASLAVADAEDTLLSLERVLSVARDAETGRIGTYQTNFVVPNLNKEEKRVAISSVVLSGQRVEIRDALYNAVKNKDRAEVANPLVQNGQKLIPSVTRVFRKDQDLYVYLQAYQQGAEDIQPVVAFVSVYRGQKKVYETPSIKVTEGANNRVKIVPLRFNLSLQNLPPDRYEFQVTVLDPTGQKAAYWQAPIMLIP